MDEFENNEFEDKEMTIEKCLEAINETQNKIAEEESMKRIIRETLKEINEKEILEKDKNFKNAIENKFKRIEVLLSKKKVKNIIMRIMMFLVMTIFTFNGALNKAYANDYELNNIANTNLNNETSRDDIGAEAASENNNSNQNEIKSSKGVNKEGEEYSYDAVKINDKLKKGDYSNGGEKIVFLTFDDGTSTTVTPKVLKILDQYNIKATFFLMGKNIDNGGEAAKELVKEEYNSGHAIGNHSYSHDYNILYPGRTLNLESFKEDFNKNTKLLKSILGDDFSTRVIRCPGGYMSWKGMNQLDGYLNDNNMTYIDWNALSKDAEGKKKNAYELFQNAVDTSKNKEIVVLLMHDTYGKEETAKSLPKIIEYFKNSGYEFKTLA
ncbi:MAG: polysaccharide deacetylase family protein [Clostridium butyricum]|uniref:polysaccharide deacetylase family protein n=1 Tax=Clostridium butyricum TaxID=1492 RepID=UPI0018AA9EBE|nr:polysaccharide deacetylase family protein [Clostridium butyricum]MDU6039374.1 polysaccharide deacetylase family protein [Clostridium butyricum]